MIFKDYKITYVIFFLLVGGDGSGVEVHPNNVSLFFSFLHLCCRPQGTLCFHPDGWHRTVGQLEVCLHQHLQFFFKRHANVIIRHVGGREGEGKKKLEISLEYPDDISI